MDFPASLKANSASIQTMVWGNSSTAVDMIDHKYQES